MWCPCRDCLNGDRHVPSTVKYHLGFRGFMPDYTLWRKHGEKEDSGDDDDSSDPEELSDSNAAVDVNQDDDI